MICLYRRCAAVINDVMEAASDAKEDCRCLIENDYFLLRFSSRILALHFHPDFILRPLLALYPLQFFTTCSLLPLLREQKFCWMCKWDTVVILLAVHVCARVCVCACVSGASLNFSRGASICVLITEAIYVYIGVKTVTHFVCCLLFVGSVAPGVHDCYRYMALDHTLKLLSYLTTKRGF